MDRFSSLPAEIRQHILQFLPDVITLKRYCTVSRTFAEDTASVTWNHALPLAEQCLADSEYLYAKACLGSSSILPVNYFGRFGFNRGRDWWAIVKALGVRVEVAWMLCATYARQLRLLRQIGLTTSNLVTDADLMRYLVSRAVAVSESHYSRSNYLFVFNMTEYVLEAPRCPILPRSISEIFDRLPALLEIRTNKPNPRLISMDQNFDLLLWPSRI